VRQLGFSLVSQGSSAERDPEAKLRLADLAIKVAKAWLGSSFSISSHVAVSPSDLALFFSFPFVAECGNLPLSEAALVTSRAHSDGVKSDTFDRNIGASKCKLYLCATWAKLVSGIYFGGKKSCCHSLVSSLPRPVRRETRP